MRTDSLRPKQEGESVGSAAAAGAALGAVLSLTLGSTALIPVAGALLGAAGGAGVGHFANLIIQRRRSEGERSEEALR